jgi:hypothetical protein
MPGMNGFSHSCESQKFDKNLNKKSIRMSAFSKEQVDLIWDFYVTHSFAGESGQAVTLEDYGWNLTKNREKTLSLLEIALMQSAGVSRLCCIRAATIKDTLTACDLSNSQICIEHPRIVLQQKFSVTVDENEKISFAGGGENRVYCLFRHIRNAFAHGNTYFFDNGTVLLEDKDGSKITAEILVNQQTLLDWIKIIDKDERFYRLVDLKENEDGTTNN